MGFYGRSFKLKDTKCWKPGCTFTGPGDKGECTNTAGFLSYAGESLTMLDTSSAFEESWSCHSS